MKQVIIIHGMPSKEGFYNKDVPSPSNAHWIPWLQKQLVLKDIISQALEMPQPYFPVYEDWKNVFEQMNISSETVLIGHSCGAGFLIRYLSENKEISPKQVILVAPWIDPEDYLLEQENNFFDFEIDPEMGNRTDLHVFTSSDDDDYIIDSVTKIKQEVPHITMHEFTDKGHFCTEDLVDNTFPELLEVTLS